jgi:5'-nucleotidase
LALALGACGVAPARDETVAVTIAAINDFHGNLRPPPEPAVLDGMRVAAGGSAQLATLIHGLRARSANFAFVSAGDLVGATPLPAAYFDDEPVVESMNLMGLDYNGVGNHEFDWGVAHLRRLQDGGCPPAGCKSGMAFGGARFRMLAANVIDRVTGKALFAPYGIKDYGSVKVAFVGVTLKATHLMLSPSAAAGLEFRDEAESVNALVPEFERQGVGAIVVLIHQGGFAAGGANACRDPWGPIFELAPRFDKAVRVVVSGHTHQAYVCTVGDKLVTSAGSYGRYVTEIQLGIQGRILSASAVNHVVRSDSAQDASQTALLARYASLAGELDRVVGRISASIPRQANADGESLLGRVIADSQLAATKDAGAVVAFMNAGGIRASRMEGRRSSDVRRGLCGISVQQSPRHDVAHRRPDSAPARAATRRHAAGFAWIHLCLGCQPTTGRTRRCRERNAGRPAASRRCHLPRHRQQLQCRRRRRADGLPRGPRTHDRGARARCVDPLPRAAFPARAAAGPPHTAP